MQLLICKCIIIYSLEIALTRANIYLNQHFLYFCPWVDMLWRVTLALTTDNPHVCNSVTGDTRAVACRSPTKLPCSERQLEDSFKLIM
jgi:hypothetical protein